MRSRIRALLFAALLLAALLVACGTPASPGVQLDVSIAGTGDGSVVSDPVGIDTAGGDFEAEFANGTTVTLTAGPAAGSTFAGFSFPAGATYACEAGSSGTTCVLTMDEAKSVVATFTLEAVDETLTVGIVVDGEAAGSVTSVPAGIDTGAGAFSADFQVGTTVVLTAVADAEGFAGWTGGDCAGLKTTTCTITMSSGEPQVNANFNDIETVTLRVDGGGNDAEEFLEAAVGSPTSFPAGYVWATSDSLELTFDPYHAPQIVALRFTNVTIPTGALVREAVLQFTARNRPTLGGTGTAGDVPITIAGEAAADPAGFANDPDGTGSSGISNRSRTSASVLWTASGAWVANATYEAANAAAIVQEIIGIGGWASGNALVMFLEGEEGNEEFRRAYSYEVANNLGAPERATALTVEFVALPVP